jgi:hypothetical protein
MDSYDSLRLPAETQPYLVSSLGQGWRQTQPLT